MRRRHFLTVTAATVGGLFVDPLSGEPQGSIRIPLRFFTEEEALDVAAAASRIFPTDDAGPGATEAGVVIYIDRQLAGPYGRDRYRYTRGPFEDGVPEQGYQQRHTPRDIYRQGLPKIAGVAHLSSTDQDAKLRAIETTLFFSLLRTHTIEGMFCDPMHGGNKDMVGWRIIGFPGPRMSYLDEVDKYRGEAFRPKPMSLAQVLGRAVKPSEDDADR